MVKIYIDEREYDVPAGTNLVDAAKWYADNDVPVFCYHPKMSPVGMCRMCLVELGSVERDKDTKAMLFDDSGKPKVRWLPKLQTACTQIVADGMTVRTATQQVIDGRRNVVEFLLTSHPLDCPICDKGGECPLQNLTMAHGPGGSRMNFDDKLHLDKHVALGTTSALIYLDEERCIQCARCVRFQDEVVGDDVLAFHERGRRLQIITTSEPFGFDTYFSGNTTDICPVGALTTADFRFGARPWEMTNVPSICPHCPVGCNTSLSMRLDRDFGGRAMIKRVMPRQNEWVNEIWICDKGRFGHHFTRSDERLLQPTLHGGEAFTPATWVDALNAATNTLREAGGNVAAIAGSSMSNEDLFTLRQLVTGLGGSRLGAWSPTHDGAEIVAQVGVGAGTNLGKLGKGDAVLVIAADLEEEAPIWRLRVKQARDRGATVIVANARKTRLDDFATTTITYATGEAVEALTNLKSNYNDAFDKLWNATNLVVFAGADGLTLESSRALMQTAANLLIDSGHYGKPQNGLIGVFPGANAMGLHYFGFTPEATLDIAANPPKVLIVAQADLVADDPKAAQWLGKVETIISLSLFPDEVSGMARVALPIQSFAERDGTFTNGERRVQRFYTAQGPMGEAIPAWQAISRLNERLGLGKAKLSAAAVMSEIAKTVPAFAGVNYAALSKVERQYPDVGGTDLYYGGTSYKNEAGLGVQIPTSAEQGQTPARFESAKAGKAKSSAGKLLIVPTTKLYNRERVFQPSQLVQPRVMLPTIELNSADAQQLNVKNGDVVEVSVDDARLRVRAHVNGAAPQGTALLPRHLSVEATPLTISAGDIRKVEG
jgi:NADH-quinone oxidoreductase subunit G